MRPFLPRLACMIFTGIAVLSAPAHAQDITSNLVAHWRMDETAGTTVNDSIGAVNGTTHGSLNPATRSVSGVIGTALYFDGSGDYANFGTGNLNMGTQSMTISMWIRLNACNTSEYGLLSKRFNSVGADGYSLRVNCLSSNRRIEAALGGAAPTTYHATGASTIPLNTWVHVAGVWNRAGNMTVYLNGVADGSISIAAENGLDIQNTDTLLLGFLGDNSYLHGSIDDVRVYTRALAPADVTSLAADQGFTCASPNGKTGQMLYNTDYKRMQYCNGTQWVAVGKGTEQLTGLLAHWKLDDTSGRDVIDASGNGYNGTWTDVSGNDLSGESSDGYLGRALDFDGVNDRISFGDVLDFDFANARTFTAWIKPDTLVASTYADEILSKQRITSGLGGWNFALTQNGRLRFQYVYNTNTNEFTAITDNAVVTTGSWQHVAVVYDNRTALFYVNGVLVPSTITINNIANNIDTSVPLNIGNRYDDSWSNGYTEFDGLIDDVRVYNRALTPSEVNIIYNISPPTCTPPSTANLIGHWNMNETSSGIVSDLSGTGNNGTWEDGANNDVTEETIAGRDGTALSFDGTDNRIVVPHSASLDVSTGYTVSGWMYFDSTATNNNPAIIAKDNVGGWGHGWIIGRSGAGGNVIGSNVRMVVTHNRNMTSGSSTHFTSWIFPVDTWNYVTFSWDGSYMRIYLNGVHMESKAITTPPDADAGDLLIGFGRYNDYQAYFQGGIDDLRIYNRALSTNEIASLYGTLGGTCVVEACANPFGVVRSITYNTTHNVMQYCDGTRWVAMGKPGDGGANCSNPSGTAGTMFYNTSYNLYQYCEGDEWVSVGQIDPCDHNPSAGTTCQSGMVYVGDTPDGNVPMYMTSITHESGTLPWDSTAIYEVTGATSTTDGDGNSATLIARPTAYAAAEHCDNLTAHGHSDWYLPAIDELDLIWNAGTPFGDIRTDGTTYWSSTENGNTTARIKQFNNGNTANFDKNVYTRARCVRTGTAQTPVTGNLLAHWKLDETSGTTATDEIAVNNGTMTAMDGATNTVSGQDGTALSFASSSRITAATSTTNIDDIFNGGTIAYWVYPTNWGTFGRVIDKSDTGTFPPNSGWHTQGATGLIKFSQAFSGTYGDWETGAGTVPMNQWSHIVISYDNSSAANVPSFYINGVLSPTTTITAPSGTAVSDAANPITIGSRQGGGNNYTGYIDDIQMYDYMLNATEIQDLYDSYTSPAPTDDLIGHWKLDETSGNLIADSSTSNIDGTWSDSDDNDVTGETGAGILGTSLGFDGTDDVISLGDNFDITGEMTVCAWARPTSGIGYVIGKYSAGSNTGFFLRVNNTSSWTMGTDNVNFIRVDNSVDYNSWQHICAVFVPSPGTSTLYKDGAAIGSNTTTPAHAPNNIAATIGNRYDNGRPFDGRLDDVRIYSTALTATEIQDLYNETSLNNGLVAHWEMNETTGTSISDSSGNGYNAAMLGAMDAATSTVPGKVGTALHFDGVDDRIDVGSISEILGSQHVTISAWLKRDAANDYVHFWGGSASAASLGIGYYSTTLWTGVNDGSGGNQHATQSGAANDTNWHHVVMVYDGTQTGNTNRLKLYVDNVQATLNYNTAVPATMHNDAAVNMIIGSYGSGRSRGSIDDLRVYNRTLSTSEISALYDLGN